MVAVATVVAAILFLPVVGAVEVIKDSVWAAAFARQHAVRPVGTDYFAQGSRPRRCSTTGRCRWRSSSTWSGRCSSWSGSPGQVGERVVCRDLRTPLLLVGRAEPPVVRWSLCATYESPTTAYFSTLTRAWGLGVGSALAILCREARPGAAMALEVLGVAGVGAVVVACVAYSPSTPFPGYQRAASGPRHCGAVLRRGRGPGRVHCALLSVPPARVVGDWSYSLYLWHWPIIRIAEDRLHVARLPLEKLAVALVLVFGLSCTDLPLRRGAVPRGAGCGRARGSAWPSTRSASRWCWWWPSAGGAWVENELGIDGDNPAITTADFQGEKLSKDPHVALVQASTLAAQEGQPIPSDLVPGAAGAAPGHRSSRRLRLPHRHASAVRKGDVDSDKVMVLIGDSHARAWSPAFSELGRQQGYRTYYFVYSGCSATRAVQAEPQNLRPWDDCENFKDWVVEAVGELDPDVVVVATSAVSPIVGDDGDPVGSSTSVRSSWTWSARASPRSSPAQTVDRQARGPRQHAQTASRTGSVHVPRRGSHPEGLPVQAWSAHAFGPDGLQEGGPVTGRRSSTRRPGSRYRLMCPPVIGRIIAMRDSEHMTPEYAVELAEPLARRLAHGGGDRQHGHRARACADREHRDLHGEQARRGRPRRGPRRSKWRARTSASMPWRPGR